MPSHAQAERHALADALIAVGPDAPTLCEGWTARDLAAHVVVRDGRPDAMIGLITPPDSFLTRRLARIQDGAAAGDFTALVEKFRSGPPLFSAFSFPGMDAASNLGEFYVHAEDVIRAQPGWQPRDLPADRQDALWKQVSAMGRMMLRKSPAQVELATPDGRTRTIAPRNAGKDVVRIAGAPAELALFLFGRKDHAQVELDGPADQIAAIRSLKLGI